MAKPSEDELLGFIKAEMHAAIGFENDSELIAQREKANQYARGIMTDVQARPKRSSAVSTDVNDVVETVLPQILDIYTEEDSIRITPNDDEDEDAARKETEYLKRVVFSDNDGWLVLYTVVKDALLQKTGHVKWWWDKADDETDRYEVGSVEEVVLAREKGAEVFEDDGKYVAEVKRNPGGKACIAAIDPNDFAICRDGVMGKIQQAPYLATQSTPRAQTLIRMGIERAKVDLLEAWSDLADNAAKKAEDTVQETSQGLDSASRGDLRKVCVREHYLRTEDEDGSTIYQILTDRECANLLLKEEVSAVQQAAGAVFINTHHFYGRSLADLTVEIQKVRTALLRMGLDNGYFALNRRPVVNTSLMTEDTLPDLLLNEPGRPIRAKAPGGVEWPTGGNLDFDVWGAMEQAAVMGEQRHGVMRNAQGLNPDTMHDTASGALALLTAAQRRVRMMARVFAETCLKDFYLGLHAMLREQDPNFAFAKPRTKLTIEIGPNGRDQDLLAARTIGEAQAQMVEAQGGIEGPLMNPKAIQATGVKIAQAQGYKNPERFFPDPADYQPPNQGEPPPDPALVKAQLDAQNDQAKLQLDTDKAIAESDQKERQMAFDAQQQASNDEFKRWQIEQELAERQRQFDIEFKWQQQMDLAKLQIERERLDADIVKHEAALANKKELADKVQAGGEPG